jgi:alpha-L-rhamnosidase
MHSLTPFIWTPRQEIRIDRYADKTPPREDGLDRWFLLRRSLELRATPDSAPVKVTADGRYILFVNGRRVGRGPVRCNPLYQRYDEYDLAPHLKAGRNVIAALVHTYGVDAAFYEMAKGTQIRTFGDGGFWMEGQATVGNDETRIETDEFWRITQCSAWQSDVPRTNWSLGFIEVLDGRALPPDWTNLTFDDSGWDQARELYAGRNKRWPETGIFENRPFPTLMPSGIPQLAEEPVAATRIVWSRGLRPEPKLRLEERLFKESFAPLPAGSISAHEDLLRFEGGNCVIRTTPDCDVTVLLDFGRILTGRPRIHIEAHGGEQIEIACSEKIPGEWKPGGAASEARISPAPFLGADNHLSRYTARAGDQVFERFEWCAIRWMQLVVRNAPRGVCIKGLGAVFVRYPVETRGKFSCSDPVLTNLWSTGAYTLSLCMHDAWEDCPSREQRQWLGDATVENLVGHAAFGPSVAALNAKFLLQVAESQRPDGLTQMFAPGDHRTDGLLIPDWTLQWILNARDHCWLTGDLETINTILPSVLKATAWFERLLDRNCLVSDMPYWHFIDWAYLGREGEACALNAQLAGAFDAAAELCAVLAWEREASRLRGISRRIAAALRQRHWDELRGAYVDVVDPLSGKQELKISQHSNAAMTLWCEPPHERASRALDRIMDSDRLTFTIARPIVTRGDELDPESGVVLANTFFAHFVYEALCKHGRLEDALRLMRERYGPMLALGATTLWESFEPTASLCHGFSASPTYQMSRRILGVSPSVPGFEKVLVAPNIANLEDAQGIVPTANGDVEVMLHRTKAGFHAAIRAPDGVETTIEAPPRHSLTKSPINSAGRVEAEFVRETI